MRISLDGWDFFGIVEEKLFGGCGFDAQSGVVSRGSLVLAGGYMEREMEYLQKAGEYLTNVITTISYTNYIIYKISLENTLEIWKDANISLNWVSSCDKALLSKLKYQSSNIKAITWKPDYRSAIIEALIGWGLLGEEATGGGRAIVCVWGRAGVVWVLGVRVWCVVVARGEACNRTKLVKIN